MNGNDSTDLQRTPQFTQPRRDIPIPEKDILDPVAEYNRGELDAMKDIDQVGFRVAREVLDELLDGEYSDYVQGYADALEFEGKREI